MHSISSHLRRGVVVFGIAALPDPAFAQSSTERVSVDSAGGEADLGALTSALSADGRIVAFDSLATNLVAGDTNLAQDVFVHDRATGVTERISVDSSGAQADGSCWLGGISADGRVVVFVSGASNLVAGDTNGTADVFVHDRSTGATERVSVSSTGEEANGWSSDGSISADGNVVAFTSFAYNLVANDTSVYTDVFVHDRTTGKTRCMSRNDAGTGNGRGDSFRPALSADGLFVAFASRATDLVAGDTNGETDVFVRDRKAGTTERVSVSSSGAEGNRDSGQGPVALSADGRFVAFTSSASNLIGHDVNAADDVFLRDRSAGTTERVSVDSSGGEADLGSSLAGITPDGQIVTFTSYATDLVDGDANGNPDAFTHDRASGTTRLVSVDRFGEPAGWGGFARAISSDGATVAFSSGDPNLVPHDWNGTGDVFVNERCTIDAAWSNYGAGFPGTHGVPAFTARSLPVVGTTVTLDLANSSGAWIVGLLFVGVEPTSLHSSLGGDLLVIPLTTLVVGLPPTGTSFSGELALDGGWCGTTVDLQAIELDAGAVKGVSFTTGLELVPGR